MDKQSSIEKVIQYLNSKEEYPLSIVEVGDIPVQYLDEIKQMVSVYGEYDSNFKLTRGVYKTKSGFYIYVDRIIQNYFNCNVYFNPEQLNEVGFFINKLKKKTYGNTNV
jgi:hypothetical protein